MNAPLRSHARGGAVFDAAFVVIRTALLPFDEFVAWGNASDRAALRERLGQLVARPDVREALFVSSPNILERLHLWQDDPDSRRGRKIEQVLVRYVTRMATRATPFGLCAGYSVGRIAAETALVLEGRDAYRRHTRIETGTLVEIMQAAAGVLRNALQYRVNASLYRAAGRLRYVESRFDGEERWFHAVALEPSEALDDTLSRAQNGATFRDLAEALVSDDVSREEADAYVAELIESRILVPDFGFPLTGREPVDSVIEQLRAFPETAGAAKELERTRALLAEIDAMGVGVDPQRYGPVRDIHVDLCKPAPALTLGEDVVDELRRGALLLHRMFPRPPSKPLERFTERFLARYETREVPLFEALDEEAGIGFGETDETSELLKDLVFSSEKKDADDERRELLLRRLLDPSRFEISLDANELEALDPGDAPPLPDAFAVAAIVAAASQAALAAGDFQILLQGINGPSGAVFVGRFCHSDETLRHFVEQHLRAEEALRPDAVFAEIVHLSEGRAANVVARPLLRAFEIPCLGTSGAPPDRQIPLDDLVVSVREGRIRLRSARLGREVIPRMTHAHNYMQRGPAIYRFLGALQQQGVAARLGWDWGSLAAAPFLPRVTAGQLVLSPARWRVTKEELRDPQWRAKRALPRFVSFTDDDAALLVDFENILSVESFVQLVKERDEAILVELFPGPDQLCVRGPEGAFVHELLVPFVRRANETQTVVREPRASHVQRRFPPGSEWMYMKLYAGQSTLDDVLRRLVPLARSADRWFFLRYADPEHHLRLRVQGTANKLQRAAASLIDEGLLWRVQFDTYEREVERYGGAEGVELAERIFHADSVAAAELIEMLEPGDEGTGERWRLALCGVDLLLDDFGLDLAARRELLEAARDSLLKQFGAPADIAHQMGTNFRAERAGLERLLDAYDDRKHPLAPGLKVLRARSRKLRPLAAELARLELSIAPRELLVSYTHMHVNRMLRSAQRQQEAVICDYLVRLYESRLRRVTPDPRKPL